MARDEEGLVVVRHLIKQNKTKEMSECCECQPKMAPKEEEKERRGGLTKVKTRPHLILATNRCQRLW